MTTLAPLATSRQAWSRLALLALTLTITVGALLLSLAWLWPQPPSRTIEVPLADLEVGVPLFIRPFDMGGNKGHANGIWLVRNEVGEVAAFSSALPHPSTCGLEVRTIQVHEPVSVGPEPNATPLPLPRDSFGRPLVSEPRFTTGFRDACEPASFFLDGRVNWSWSVPLSSLDYFRTEIRGAFVLIDAGTVFLGCDDPLDCPQRKMPVQERNLP